MDMSHRHPAADSKIPWSIRRALRRKEKMSNHVPFLLEAEAAKFMSTQINPNKALWEKGDFTRIAETMRDSGEAVVQSLGITPGLKVLDVGCGDGTTAIPEAKRGADVLGVDIASNLVDAANRRARAMGLKNARFQQGDACDLA